MINGQTRRAAQRRGYDVRHINGIYEVYHLHAKDVVAVSLISAVHALSLIKDIKRNTSVIPPEWAASVGKTLSCGDLVARLLTSALRHPEHGRVMVVELEKVAIANSINPRRWDHLNVGLRRMALGTRLRGILRGSMRFPPKSIVIGDQLVRPGDDAR